MFRLITPTKEDELNAYFHFRWQMLREPWCQPEGSERDAYDVGAIHRMIVDAKGEPIAIGRLYISPDNDGQIRYMAVSPDYRKRGLGALILMALESLARQEGAKRLVCNAREDAIGFYSGNGFVSQGELNEERGPVRHQQMLKPLDMMSDVVRRPEWCSELQKRWQTQIPISDKMGIRITQFTGYRFEVSALLNANLNPHDSMFAGSVFSMATLTGWGMVWLLMKERQLTAGIVLADSHIRYRKPITERPRAVVSLDGLSGDLDRLADGRKARVKLEVTLYSGDEIAGVFAGTYMLVPEESTSHQHQTPTQTLLFG
ncbi:bifunctional GNAT family N-acetyltransferase/hotdog fold thioesterase [Enterovibrio norvegicus]|uniref:GNAT family N-acetyltransferase n=2 Tax=Enterovibrio norvegicus TaxID=188144 RepID=A0A2N7L7K2_9GAMM|nr:bifunctional GNAT family N-acetyltransferase/hotdog fold thioesterase [Enterovibrio norvegicus]MCC4797452.1 bifunctional GNAT family N-acetyltransferase/hotdog fold thioesterase [Enterovibrio norvegicus]OEE52904.1 GNAT family N-acetyltransferase [Enterovibrio norvegicus]OEF49107.1 GNAT family N-acetyltransferase [Enterovibrio norvegicus]OEF59957.1 GNAT family N-acetyltransferase [Enterovibrio norvegicus]PMH64649.1 GNAT family N-acetyltransferase [Enterovibrio norvegicus]